MTPDGEPETYEAARARLSAQAVRSLLEAALLIEQVKSGKEAAQRLHDSVEEGVSTLEFALRMEATCASIVGVERGPAGARCVLDVLIFAPPGAALSLN
jgi:hypothetical protein